jgi:hypothetical protein
MISFQKSRAIAAQFTVSVQIFNRPWLAETGFMPIVI